MYRVAIVTDIHGNIYALNAVLDALFGLDNIQMITGNHDELVLAILNNESYPDSRINVTPHHEWIAERLNKQHVSRLERLPRIVNSIIYEQNFHLIHYPMKESLYDAHISKDPFDSTGIPSSENFSNINGLQHFSLICFGHNHSQHHITCNNKTFYNPGSLGCFNEPYAPYGIIDIDEDGFNIKQRNVPYEFDSYVDELRKITFPRKEIILRIYK